MFENFGRIFLPAALAGYSVKKSMLSKQERVLQLLYISINIKAGRFSSQDEIFT